MPKAQIGTLTIEIEPGFADRQLVRVSDRWRAGLLRSTKSAPGLHVDDVERLMGALERTAGQHRVLSRQTMRECAASGALDSAYLTVMAWGLGTSGYLGRGASWARKALSGSIEHLAASRIAVTDGATLSELWQVHFSRRPPTGLGSVAFGSKWLYAVGYGRVAGDVAPLIYDNNIYVALHKHAGLPGYAPAINRPYTSWIRWCTLASETADAVGHGVSAADVEVALFNFAQRKR